MSIDRNELSSGDPVLAPHPSKRPAPGTRGLKALAARLQRRPTFDLYHSALQVEVPEGTFVIEQAPVHDWSGKDRGVVAEGAVGAQWAGRFRIFRYEIRRWSDGRIPDVDEAVDSPRRQ